MKLSEFTQQNDFAWELQTNSDAIIKLISTDYPCLVSHFDPIMKKRFACVGKDKGCPYCPDPQPVKRFIGYILVNNEVKLASLPWSILSKIRSFFDEDPDSFAKDEDGKPTLPKFFVKVSAYGQGYDKYAVEKDMPDEQDYDITNMQTPEDYIKQEKEKALEFIPQPENTAEIKPLKPVLDAPLVELEEEKKEININNIPF